ncbi:TMEM175 family protein [Deinococcus rubellus]|uniref:TMEM175 family protein n=1 Tax=Deinococcus rubellus TaxID=1889240 RepID=A0ABY5YDA4_9DEIO|nr:TMEM175 family protein [Deinococcus rubellus]UWX63050.1 TMEM175 family protein [Deinococcus rubellus]
MPTEESLPAADAQDIPLSRLHGLSDGVFAIVMTLLVLQLNLPEVARGLGEVAERAAVNQALIDLLGKLAIYVLTFLVTGLSWLSHSRLYTFVRRSDQRLAFLNVLYLMTVSLLPFSAAVLGAHGGVQAGVWPYALNQMLISAAYVLMLSYVRVHALVGTHAPIRMLAIRAWLNLAVFAVMGLLAFVQPSIAWFAPVLLGVVQPLLSRLLPHD